MSVDFFTSTCSEGARTDELFGLCDDQNSTIAYSDTTNSKKWVATVINNETREVVFTPIDYCITVYKEGTNDQESTCDGMLTTTDTLYLVELKTGVKGWQSQAIDQILNTIRLIAENHNLSAFRFKKGFACNNKHPNFAIIDNELNKRVFKATGFRLDAQANIVIK